METDKDRQIKPNEERPLCALGVFCAINQCIYFEEMCDD